MEDAEVVSTMHEVEGTPIDLSCASLRQHAAGGVEFREAVYAYGGATGEAARSALPDRPASLDCADGADHPGGADGADGLGRQGGADCPDGLGRQGGAGGADGPGRPGSAGGADGPARQARPALAGVDLSIAAGEFVAVLGANGSGKSTLARHINALLTPSEGRVFVDGVDTCDGEHVFAIRSTAGLLFQNPDSQMVASIVADDVAFGPENLCVPHQQIAERVNAALDDVKMAAFAERDPLHLSGGQKQRVCIAGLLAMHPNILVLDEPGAMLDARGRRGLRRVMKELNAEGMTIVLITHFMEEAAMAKRLVVMDAGRVVLDGPPREVFAKRGLLRELGLELPFTVRLAEALRERGLDMPDVVSPSELKRAVACRMGGEGGGAASGGGGVVVGGSGGVSVVDAGAAPCSSVALSDAALPRALQAEGALGMRVSGRAVSPKPPLEQDAASASAPTSQSLQPASPPPTPPTPPHVTAPQPPQPATELRGACYSYPGTPVLKNISLSIAQGSLVGVIGHSGSGKSTLLQLLSGLEQPSAGSVLVAGRDLKERKARAGLHKTLGVAFQYPEYQLFARSVAEDVAFAPRNAGLSAKEADERAREALAMVGLGYGDFARRSPFSLSGGERRRVALAGIIAQDPSILLFDEPTNGLDPRTHNEVLAVIGRLHRAGKTVVVVSHDLDAIAAMAERVIVLNAGEVLMDGTPEEVFSRHEQLRSVNLDVPQPMATAAALGLEERPLSLEALANMIAKEYNAMAKPGRAASPRPPEAASATAPAPASATAPAPANATTPDANPDDSQSASRGAAQ